MALGEVVTWTGEEAEGDDSKGTTKFTFVKIKTIDEKVGWIWSKYIARVARPAVIIEKTSKYIKPMDVIAVVKESENWLKVYTEREGSSRGWWIENDINTAVLGKRALAEKDNKKKRSLLII